MKHARNVRITLLLSTALVAVLNLTLALPASAQTAKPPAQGKSADEVAAELANPNNSLGTLTFNLDTKWFGGTLAGAGDQKGVTLQFQPSFPYPLGKGTNLFVRPALPFVFSQPIPQSSGGFESEGSAIGDLGFDVAIGKSLSGGWLVVAGMVGNLPTATNDNLSANKVLLGPEFLLARATRKLVVGLLLTQAWNVNKRDEGKNSVTSGQYFLTVPVKNGWQIASSPLFSYDHNASSGNQWSFPVGGGVNKTSIFGKTPWKFSAQYWYYAVAPDKFGSRHQFRISISPVVPLPW